MTSSNDKRLFWASFLTLIAAGVGFSVRGDLLKVWGEQFGFNQSQLGTISGFGLVGFGITIIALSFITDRIGYGPLMVLAFVLHLSSGIVTLAATVAFTAYGKEAAYWCLAAGGFLFSLANGTCEAVINPLTATLFPNNKTHWLNILHAGWPGGLVLGAFLGLMFSYAGGVRWEVQMGMFLVPTLVYGLLMVGRRFPTSEAAAAGVGLKTMLLEFVSPVLLLLLVLHALVGYVELGTDNWIQNITGNIMDSRDYAKMDSRDYAKILFIWTSGLMFGLRFFAGPIVHKISPLGLLFASAVIACAGLYMLGSSKMDTATATIVVCFVAGTIYGIGKTFFWPTMLGVVSERYPKGGALTLGAIGGVGMLSAGLLGAPGIGYKQDYFASKYLEANDPAALERYAPTTDDGSIEKKTFLYFPPVSGLDGSKVGVLADDGRQLKTELEAATQAGRQDKNLENLNVWWQSAKMFEKQDKVPVEDAVLAGGTMALKNTAAVPAVMALGYLILILYFRAIGGYKAEVLVGHAASDEKFTGGVVGPAEL